MFVSHSLITRKKEKSGEEQIDDDDQKNRHDHSPSCRSAHLLCSGPSRQPFEAPDGRNGDSEHKGLHQSSRDVVQKERVNRSADVTGKCEVRLGYAKETSTE